MSCQVCDSEAGNACDVAAHIDALRGEVSELREAMGLQQQVARLNITPGDRLVLRVPGTLHAEVIRRFSERIRDWAGGTPVLVLEGGATLDVVRMEHKEGAS